MPVRGMAITHKGKVRGHNEDALYIAGQVLQGADLEQLFDSAASRVLLVAADGMGGYEQGEVASRLVCEALPRMLTPQQVLNRATVEDALLFARQGLEHHALQHPASARMGTTVAGLWLEADYGLVFNVGDSRVYRWEAPVLKRLTQDHTQVWERVRQGALTAEEARRAENRHTVTSALTVYTNPLETGCRVRPLRFSAPATFLLCTDGVWETMPEQALQDVLEKPGTLAERSRALKRRVLETAARDNFSLILAEICLDL